MDNVAELGYTPRHFAPDHVHRPHSAQAEAGDSRRAPVYVYTEAIVLAVNVAIATRRPLLVRGESGSGKSSLARNIADVLRWRYYETVITSRTEARDLLWDVDLVRRLHDARASGATLTANYAPYVVPGVLWWAFNGTSAQWRGTDPALASVEPVPDPASFVADRAVVLLDEIDKADPDFPNNLLVPLGSLQFTVEETGTLVAASQATAPLVVITTNEERELAPAFLRRCVELKLERPSRTRLLEITRAHFSAIEEEELDSIADALLGPAVERSGDAESPLSPAEFLDTVAAKLDLSVDLQSETWNALAAITAWKHGKTPPG